MFEFACPDSARMAGLYVGVSCRRSNLSAKRSACLVDGQIARSEPEYLTI